MSGLLLHRKKKKWVVEVDTRFSTKELKVSLTVRRQSKRRTNTHRTLDSYRKCIKFPNKVFVVSYYTLYLTNTGRFTLYKW